MDSKKLTERGVRVGRMIKVLHESFPEAATELHYSTPWELLVAVQLSAQSTDVQLIN